MHIQLNYEEESDNQENVTKKETEQEEKVLCDRADVLLGWFVKLIEHLGDGMRRLICNNIDALSISSNVVKRLKRIRDMRIGEEVNMIDSQDESQCLKLMTLLFEIDYLLPWQLGKEMRNFYFSLIGDALFKRKFAFYFVGSYVSFMDQRIESVLMTPEAKRRRKDRLEERGTSYQNLTSLSVQLFTVPIITPALVRDGNLLEILIGKLASILDKYIFTKVTDAEGKEEIRFNSDSAVLSKRVYWHLIDDLQSVLHIRPVARWLVYKYSRNNDDTNLLKTLVRVQMMLQGMDRNVRQLDTHVEYESELWLEAITLEMQL